MKRMAFLILTLIWGGSIFARDFFSFAPSVQEDESLRKRLLSFFHQIKKETFNLVDYVEVPYFPTRNAHHLIIEKSFPCAVLKVQETYLLRVHPTCVSEAQLLELLFTYRHPESLPPTLFEEKSVHDLPRLKFDPQQIYFSYPQLLIKQVSTDWGWSDEVVLPSIGNAYGPAVVQELGEDILEVWQKNRLHQLTQEIWKTSTNPWVLVSRTSWKDDLVCEGEFSFAVKKVGAKWVRLVGCLRPLSPLVLSFIQEGKIVKTVTTKEKFLLGPEIQFYQGQWALSAVDKFHRVKFTLVEADNHDGDFDNWIDIGGVAFSPPQMIVDQTLTLTVADFRGENWQKEFKDGVWFPEGDYWKKLQMRNQLVKSHGLGPYIVYEKIQYLGQDQILFRGLENMLFVGYRNEDSDLYSKTLPLGGELKSAVSTFMSKVSSGVLYRNHQDQLTYRLWSKQ